MQNDDRSAGETSDDVDSALLLNRGAAIFLFTQILPDITRTECMNVLKV